MDRIAFSENSVFFICMQTQIIEIPIGCQCVQNNNTPDTVKSRGTHFFFEIKENVLKTNIMKFVLVARSDINNLKAPQIDH